MPIIEYIPSAGEQTWNLPPAANMFVIGGIKFKPGFNQISELDWQTLNAHPAYKSAIALRLDSGKLRLKESPKKDAEPSIADYDLDEAVPMIQNCNDVDLLNRWKEEDARTGSQKAIAKQLKKLSLDKEEPKTKSSTASSAKADDHDTPPVYT